MASVNVVIMFIVFGVTGDTVITIVIIIIIIMYLRSTTWMVSIQGMMKKRPAQIFGT